MDGAVFTSRSSPFYPDTRYYGGESYRGIFLNQGGPPLWVSPYYSIQAPQSVDFGGTLGIRNVYLQNWSADPSNNASFEDANSSETGVVFNSSNSTTIKANLKVLHLSNDASAFSNNRQRKLIETKSGSLHFCIRFIQVLGIFGLNIIAMLEFDGYSGIMGNH